MEHKHTVLVCEDEEDLLSIYATALKKQYNVLTATSGRACVEKYMESTLRGKKVDIILLDYKLGDSTGDDIAYKIRGIDGARVIMITAYDLEREKVNELKAANCIVDVIIKPVGMKALAEKVQKALDRRDAL
jgi:two-component system KDP operon response regulator KdpE